MNDGLNGTRAVYEDGPEFVIGDGGEPSRRLGHGGLANRNLGTR
jgi:hypothetical protein